MRLVLLVLLLVIGPLATWGSPIIVTSGKHAGFTRIVFANTERKKWAVSEGPSSIRLDFDGHRDGFDTSGVFRRIGRETIEGIDLDGSGIVLRLGCDCSFTTFEENGVLIVVDITAVGKIATDYFFEERGSDDVLSFVGGNRNLPVPEESAREADANRSEESASVEENEDTLSRRTDRFLALDIEESVVDTVDLSESMQDVASRISGSVTRGILDLRVDSLPILAREKSPQVSFATPYDRLPRSSGKQPDLQHGRNIQISSSLDTLVEQIGSVGSADASRSCPNPQTLDPLTWIEGSDYNAELSRLLPRVFDDRDQINLQGLTELVRLHLYYGLGAEAKYYMTLTNEQLDDHNVLIAIAETVDAGYSQHPELAANLEECGKYGALWTALADREPRHFSSDQVRSQLLALHALPGHLRKILGPQLAKRQLQTETYEAAQTALRLVKRIPDAMTDEYQTAAAELGSAVDKPVKDGDTDLVVKSNSDLSAVALIQEIAEAFESGQESVHIDLELIESYIIQYRDSELEPQLRRAKVLALILLEKYLTAYQEAEKLMIDGKLGDKIEIISEITRRALENLDDYRFSILYFYMRNHIIEPLPLELSDAMVMRMQRLGFKDTIGNPFKNFDNDASSRDELNMLKEKERNFIDSNRNQYFNSQKESQSRNDKYSSANESLEIPLISNLQGNISDSANTRAKIEDMLEDSI